jgi:hypothetical protein
MACLCEPGYIAFEEEYSGASAIVLGKVIARRTKTYHYKSKDGDYFDLYYYEHTVRVKKAYKGAPAQIIKVATVWENVSCGMRLKRGRTYLIYAMPDERYGLYTGKCNRNYLRTHEQFKQAIAQVEERNKRQKE